MTSSRVKEFVVELALGLGVAYAFFSYYSAFHDPDRAEKLRAKNSKQSYAALLKASGRDASILDSNSTYEDAICADLLLPGDIAVDFNSIGGLETLKEEINETLIFPLQKPELFKPRGSGSDATNLLSPPTGVLLYGPPGTGKSMTAKAIAKSCSAAFINIQPSSIQSKWFGESQKLVKALFSLARKLAPTIIFIDEIDGFLRQRAASDHEASSAMKTEFMTLWDGIATQNASRPIVIIGATNRPWDLDEAVLRRLPRQYLFPLPSKSDRTLILKVLLSSTAVDDQLLEALDQLSDKCKDYSGSDLKELCKLAAMKPMRERMKSKTLDSTQPLRPLCSADFDSSLQELLPTGLESQKFLQNFQAKQSKKK